MFESDTSDGMNERLKHQHYNSGPLERIPETLLSRTLLWDAIDLGGLFEWLLCGIHH